VDVRLLYLNKPVMSVIQSRTYYSGGASGGAIREWSRRWAGNNNSCHRRTDQ